VQALAILETVLTSGKENDIGEAGSDGDNGVLLHPNQDVGGIIKLFKTGKWRKSTSVRAEN
jgi:hypothetical protein